MHFCRIWSYLRNQALFSRVQMSRLPITSTLKTLAENHYQCSVFRTCCMPLNEGSSSHSVPFAPCMSICSLPFSPHFLPKPHNAHSECWERPRSSQPPPAKVSKSFDWEPERKKSESLLPLFLKEGNKKQGRGGQQKDIHRDIHTHTHTQAEKWWWSK